MFLIDKMSCLEAVFPKWINAFVFILVFPATKTQITYDQLSTHRHRVDYT